MDASLFMFSHSEILLNAEHEKGFIGIGVFWADMRETSFEDCIGGLAKEIRHEALSNCHPDWDGFFPEVCIFKSVSLLDSTGAAMLEDDCVGAANFFGVTWSNGIDELEKSLFFREDIAGSRGIFVDRYRDKFILINEFSGDI